MTSIFGALRGQSLLQRAFRSSAITSVGFVASQAIRLASNLILTRMLFPEAFGIMAMLTVILMGLQQFSDVGIKPAIMQSKRGDDRAFLDTAWTIQIIRGFALYLAALALSWPAAWFYNEPSLTTYLPAVALTLVIQGFNPTKLDTAHRHLQAGRITVIDIATQLVGIISMLVIAYFYPTVWALVIGGILSMLAQLYFLNRFLPGPANRLMWEKPAAHELIHFGKWIFLSTICGFAIGQADKLIIGRYLSTENFGIYNIGFFLASFPFMLANVIVHRVVIPVCRENPPGESRENFLRLRKMRTAATAVLLTMLLALGLLGDWLINVMYDDRYQAAGGVVVLMTLSLIPAVIMIMYDLTALAAGDSRSFFIFTLIKASLIIVSILIGLKMGGVAGAIIGNGVALVLAYPVVTWLARRSGAWDPVHDAGFALAGVGIVLICLWLHSDVIAELSQMGPMQTDDLRLSAQN